MVTVKESSKVLLVLLAILFVNVSLNAALDISHLSSRDIQKVENVLAKLSPIIKERRQKQNLSTLTFQDLYAPLSKSHRNFLKSFQSLDANKLDVKLPYRGIAEGEEEFVIIKGQTVGSNGKLRTLPPQFLTKGVYQSYTAMMSAMEKDIGKRLYVESGYRSSAYQLYLFLFYLKNHG